MWIVLLKGGATCARECNASRGKGLVLQDYYALIRLDECEDEANGPSQLQGVVWGNSAQTSDT